MKLEVSKLGVKVEGNSGVSGGPPAVEHSKYKIQNTKYKIHLHILKLSFDPNLGFLKC